MSRFNAYVNNYNYYKNGNIFSFSAGHTRSMVGTLKKNGNYFKTSTVYSEDKLICIKYNKDFFRLKK